MIRSSKRYTTLRRDGIPMISFCDDRPIETNSKLQWTIEECAKRFLYVRRDPFDETINHSPDKIDYRRDYLVFYYRTDHAKSAEMGTKVKKLNCDHYNDQYVNFPLPDKNDIPSEYGNFTITPVNNGVILTGNGVTITMSQYQIVATCEEDYTIVWSNDGVTLIDYVHNVATMY